jgi:hypothetical protein
MSGSQVVDFARSCAQNALSKTRVSAQCCWRDGVGAQARHKFELRRRGMVGTDIMSVFEILMTVAARASEVASPSISRLIITSGWYVLKV